LCAIHRKPLLSVKISYISFDGRPGTCFSKWFWAKHMLQTNKNK
jgi:hypothetical protein